MLSKSLSKYKFISDLKYCLEKLSSESIDDRVSQIASSLEGESHRVFFRDLKGLLEDLCKAVDLVSSGRAVDSSLLENIGYKLDELESVLDNFTRNMSILIKYAGSLVNVFPEFAGILNVLKGYSLKSCSVSEAQEILSSVSYLLDELIKRVLDEGVVRALLGREMITEAFQAFSSIKSTSDFLDYVLLLNKKVEVTISLLRALYCIYSHEYVRKFCNMFRCESRCVIVSRDFASSIERLLEDLYSVTYYGDKTVFSSTVRYLEDILFDVVSSRARLLEVYFNLAEVYLSLVKCIRRDLEVLEESGFIRRSVSRLLVDDISEVDEAMRKFSWDTIIGSTRIAVSEVRESVGYFDLCYL